MGRELRRVPLDFDWPLNEPWREFLNPHYKDTIKCAACDETGSSPEGRRLHNLWYGHVPFWPEDRGSTPFLPSEPAIRRKAERNVRSMRDLPPDAGFMIYSHVRWHESGAEDREAERLCALFNGAWCHHLNADDVGALVASGRLRDLTHEFSPGNGWCDRSPPVVPTPREVNVWSLSGMGHDSINQYVVCKAECARLGVSDRCAACDGEGETWPSPEAKAACKDWQRENPPAGDGWQVWETVSEGSPISPVFSTAEDLARHMATTRWGADKGSSYETWLAWIRGPGWAPSLILTADGRVLSGVEGAVGSSEKN